MDRYKQELLAKEAKKSAGINLLDMLESRITEIVQIEKEVKKKYPKLFHQRLPRFMRRRAASHNISRVPKFCRPKRVETKDRKKLMIHRRKTRYLKNKRVLKKNSKPNYRDTSKCLLHKWFAKRFKLQKRLDSSGCWDYLPLFNNTKNQRNLYRQTRYGCAFLSMAHMIALKVHNEYNRCTLDSLNKLTESTSGFTFSARALETDRYELALHLFHPKSGVELEQNEDEKPAAKKIKIGEEVNSKLSRSYICPSYVINRKDHFILWLPRDKLSIVQEWCSRVTSLNIVAVGLNKWTRVRLVGPDARQEAMRIAENRSRHEQAILDVDRRLVPSGKLGSSIGRSVEEAHATFTYFPTYPHSVDIVLKNKLGRAMWHQLVKNKAHLVGGKRDFEVLMKGEDFELRPDNLMTKN